jgi:hypothetical protein
VEIEGYLVGLTPLALGNLTWDKRQGFALKLEGHKPWRGSIERRQSGYQIEVDGSTPYRHPGDLATDVLGRFELKVRFEQEP